MTVEYELFAIVTSSSLSLDVQWTQTYHCAFAQAISPAWKAAYSIVCILKHMYMYACIISHDRNMRA